MNPRMMAGDDYWGQFTDYAPSGAEPTFDTKAIDPNSEGANGGYSGGPDVAAIHGGAQPTMPQDWNEQTFAQQFGSPGTPQDLIALEPRLQSAGIKVLRNAAGVAGKIQLPNGQIVDIINAAGAGGRGFQWLTGDGGAPGGMGALGGGGGAMGNLAGITQGQFIAPWTEQFMARDPNQIAQDPAYQFQLGQGTQAIMRNKAAMGSLLTGGTLKALDRYGQGLASTYSDKFYDRDMGEYGLRRENFFANQDRPFSKLFQTASLGKPGA